ncbi:hypothetical protein Q5P01_020001 [Channa striata]|uniref:Uncharacterized protein n=1 Tax=Channa striata TaxID=64152 RepID=A0AA88S0M7_CHASR|nr:hypothetical protein Q5P01_020001 [Channa striata]
MATVTKFRHKKDSNETNVFNATYGETLKLTSPAFSKGGSNAVNYSDLDDMEWLGTDDRRLPCHVRTSLAMIGDTKAQVQKIMQQHGLCYNRVVFTGEGGVLRFSDVFANEEYMIQAPVTISSSIRLFSSTKNSFGSLKLCKRGCYYTVAVLSNTCVDTSQYIFAGGSKDPDPVPVADRIDKTVEGLVERIKRKVSRVLPRINVGRIKMMAPDLSEQEFDALVLAVKGHGIEVTGRKDKLSFRGAEPASREENQGDAGPARPLDDKRKRAGPAADLGAGAKRRKTCPLGPRGNTCPGPHVEVVRYDAFIAYLTKEIGGGGSLADGALIECLVKHRELVSGPRVWSPRARAYLQFDVQIHGAFASLKPRGPTSVRFLTNFGSVVGVTLRELHPLGNPAELFGRERRDKLQGDLNALMRNGSREITAERMAALARSDNWYHKIRNPASLLEFDTRNMVVPVPPAAGPGNAEPVAPARWLVRPRVALFNSSSMNSIANEIAQIGSELLARFGDTERATSVVGDRINSVVASMPACFEHERYVGANVLEHGYPTNFTLDEVDYCNLMYWIILPSLGARVYRRGAAARQAEHAVCSQLRYRNGERDLSENLGLSDANRTLIAARLTGDCAFPRIARIGNNLAKVLLGMHYSTLLTHEKSHNTHQVHTVNQYCESVVIPETLESPGLTSGYRRPYLFTTGRSQALQGLGGAVPKDPLMSAEAYTCMPTLLRPFSSTLRGSQRGRHRDCDEESNRRLFCDALHAQEFERSVLDSIGDPFKDTVERANGNKRATDIMQPSLGVAFCGTYGVGLTSDKKLMTACDPTAQEPLVERLAPRISGTGVFACNPMRTTSRLIAPVFSRVFHAPSYNRIFRI